MTDGDLQFALTVAAIVLSVVNTMLLVSVMIRLRGDDPDDGESLPADNVVQFDRKAS